VVANYQQADSRYLGGERCCMWNSSALWLNCLDAVQRGCGRLDALPRIPPIEAHRVSCHSATGVPPELVLATDQHRLYVNEPDGGLRNAESYLDYTLPEAERCTSLVNVYNAGDRLYAITPR